jgi:hypothetical protein
VAFVLAYLSALLTDEPTRVVRHLPEGTAGHEAAELPVAAALGAYLVTTLVFVVPVVLVARRIRPPGGFVTLLLTTLAGLAVTITDFERAPVIAAAFLGGAAADMLLARAAPGPVDRSTIVGAAAALAAVTWSMQFLLFAAGPGLRWPAALVGGVVALTAAAGAGAAWVMMPPDRPAGPAAG